MATKPKKKVLVVDDEPITLKVLTFNLEDAGFSVEKAQDGLEALEKLKMNPNEFALVILDNIMPNMSGLEVCRQIKNMPGLMDLPVVMLTVLKEPEQVIDAIRAGAFDYLTKPVDKALLVQMVEQAIHAYVH